MMGHVETRDHKTGRRRDGARFFQRVIWAAYMHILVNQQVCKQFGAPKVEQ